MNILMVTSSPRGRAAHSTVLANDLLTRLRAHQPDARVVVRDLAIDPPPHIDEDFVSGQAIPPDQRSAGQARAIALSASYYAEFAAADTIIIAAAMINFGMPTTLRAWFDHLLRAGLTFRYTSNGSMGLMGGRKVYLVLARGGFYSEGRFQGKDYQLPHLSTLLDFMGIEDIETITAEGLAFGVEAATSALAQASADIETLVINAGATK